MHGIQTCAELRERGWDRDRIDRSPSADGLWGLRGSSGHQEPRRDRIAAALRAAPTSAVLSGWAAGVVHGIPEAFLDGTSDGDTPLPVGFCVADKSGAYQRNGLSLRWSTVAPEDVVEVDGHLVTSPGRTVADLARWHRLPPRALAAVDMGLRFGLVTPASLQAVIARMPRRRGIRLLREVAPLGTARSESPKESELRWHWHEAGLPAPVTNAEIFDLRGDFVARVDVFEPGCGYVAEFDGGYHAEGDQPELDRKRVGRLERLNLTVGVFTKEDLRDPLVGALAGRLRHGHRRARRRDARRDGWHCPQTRSGGR